MLRRHAISFTAMLVSIALIIFTLSSQAWAESLPEARLAFVVQPGPLASQEHYAHLFLLSSGKKVAEGYANFVSPTTIRAADGHYTVLLVPVTVPTSQSAIGGAYECEISGGTAVPIAVTAVAVTNREVTVAHADGSPIPANEVEVMVATHAGAGCLVDHMDRFTTDAAGRFVLPAVPGEIYQLRMALKEYLQHPVVESPPFGAGNAGPLTVRIPAVPEVTLHFVTEQDGRQAPLVSIVPVTVRGEPDGRFMPFPLTDHGDLRLDFLPDVTNFAKARTLSLQLPGYTAEPSLLVVPEVLGRTITIICHRHSVPVADNPPPPPVPAPFTVEVVTKGEIRRDGALSLVHLTGARHDVLDIRLFTRTVDQRVVNEPAEKAFVLFAVFVDGVESVWREKVAVVPGGNFTLHVDAAPHRYALRLANLGVAPVDQEALKGARYTLVDADTGLFAGHAKQSNQDPADLQTALYPGRYHLLVDQARGQGFDLGLVEASAADLPAREISVDWQARKPIAAKAGETVMIKALSAP